MAKIDLDSLGIEELAALRESATDKLFEKVATRRAELEAELEKLAQYGKPPAKKVESAPAPKAKKSEEAKERKESEPKESVEGSLTSQQDKATRHKAA